MRLLVHDRLPGGDYRLVVHLDPTKLKDGEPDPDWVAEWTWGQQAPQVSEDPDFAFHVDGAPMRDMTDEEYRAMQREEVRSLAPIELQARQARAESESEVFASGEDL